MNRLVENLAHCDVTILGACRVDSGQKIVGQELIHRLGPLGLLLRFLPRGYLRLC